MTTHEVHNELMELLKQIPDVITTSLTNNFYLIPKGRFEKVMFTFDGMESGAELIKRIMEVAERK